MYFLKNYMEDVINSRIDAVIASFDICKCDKCKLDIKAIALNNLPPHYVVTEKGGLYTKLSEMEVQFDVDVQTAIIKAAMIVGSNQRHQDGEV